MGFLDLCWMTGHRWGAWRKQHGRSFRTCVDCGKLQKV